MLKKKLNKLINNFTLAKFSKTKRYEWTNKRIANRKKNSI